MSQFHDRVHEVEYLVTDLVPSATACLASSHGRRSLTAVWTSMDERVCFLLYLTSLADSEATFSKTSLMKEFMMDMKYIATELKDINLDL